MSLNISAFENSNWAIDYEDIPENDTIAGHGPFIINFTVGRFGGVWIPVKFNKKTYTVSEILRVTYNTYHKLITQKEIDILAETGLGRDMCRYAELQQKIRNDEKYYRIYIQGDKRFFEGFHEGYSSQKRTIDGIKQYYNHLGS